MADDAKRLGLYLPATSNFELGEIGNLEQDAKTKELLVRLYQYVTNITNAVNLKTTGYYLLTEFVDGNVFFKDPTLNPSTAATTPQFRNEYRIVVNFGALPNGGTKSVAHNIIDWATISTLKGTKVTVAATDTTGKKMITLNYYDGTNLAYFNLDVTNVNITTVNGVANFFQNYDNVIVIIEYLKF